MKKEQLTAAVDVWIEQTRTALQTVYDVMNHGQQKQIIKNEEVKNLFDRLGVEYN